MDRQRFEAWAPSQELRLNSIAGMYTDPYTRDAWAGYQAGWLAAQPQWLPIEGAPKDGTEVLLFLGKPWSKVEKARWYAPWGNWQAGVIPADPVREECGGIGSAIPTHYMPLPAPPKEE